MTLVLPVKSVPFAAVWSSVRIHVNVAFKSVVSMYSEPGLNVMLVTCPWSPVEYQICSSGSSQVSDLHG